MNASAERKTLGYTHLTNGQHVVDVQALEQWPHGKVDIDQAPTEIEAAREPSNDLETCILVIVASGCGA